jgi:hypothetical protein
MLVKLSPDFSLICSRSLWLMKKDEPSSFLIFSSIAFALFNFCCQFHQHFMSIICADLLAPKKLKISREYCIEIERIRLPLHWSSENLARLSKKKKNQI